MTNPTLAFTARISDTQSDGVSGLYATVTSGALTDTLAITQTASDRWQTHWLDVSAFSRANRYGDNRAAAKPKHL